MAGKEEKKIKFVKGAKPIKEKLRNEKEIARECAAKVQKRFDMIVKASILFGSQARDTARAASDVDIILLIDDASIDWDLELISWYREELGKLIGGVDYGRELHVNTIKLTTWWDDLMKGDPVVLNILRYGEALIDVGGFFNPLKVLLAKGHIHSTPEAVYAALQRAPSHLARSRAAELGAIEGVYWTMVDSAHASLIMAGQLPPSPEHLPIMLKENFVDKGMLNINYVKAIRDIYALHKQISHGEIRDIRGQDIDAWQKTAQDFLAEMTRIIDSLIRAKK